MNRLFIRTVLLLCTALCTPGPPLPSRALPPEPLAGVHTIRADDSLLRLAAEGGFAWLAQLVEWREIEPVPGEHFWEYLDWLARAAAYYDLDLVLRLDHPPEWALSPGADTPVDLAAYAGFVTRVAARYAGRVTAYVIWNEPNLATEWGDQPPDPSGYVEMLCAAQAAIRAVDPQALVASAGLAPTNHASATALDDRTYLRAMYAAGAADCFDVLGAHPYGFAYPPGDPPGAHDGLNYARLADLRALMIEYGDGSKPVWATEMGWTTAPVGPEQSWLRVSEEDQSQYLVDAFRRAGKEWPWLERIAVWNLSTGLSAGDEKRGYSILADDGTPTPAFRALAAMATEGKRRQPEEQHATRPEDGPVEILAPDVVVRLSDVDTFYPHWARPHCGSLPCRRWSGQFYVTAPGTEPWQLHMEIMQVEEPGNQVWLNDHLLEPPAIPLRGQPDFASVWTAVEISLPAELLQPGVNTLEIRSSPRLPVYQDRRAHFESLQFRHLRLTRAF
jgi:hypothetical protein